VFYPSAKQTVRQGKAFICCMKMQTQKEITLRTTSYSISTQYIIFTILEKLKIGLSFIHKCIGI